MKLRDQLPTVGLVTGFCLFVIATMYYPGGTSNSTHGLLFGLVALVATAYMLYLEDRWRLFAWGSLCIALLSASAVMYYGHILYAYLPTMQKLSFAASIGWLAAVYHAKIINRQEPILSTVVA